MNFEDSVLCQYAVVGVASTGITMVVTPRNYHKLGHGALVMAIYTLSEWNCIPVEFGIPTLVAPGVLVDHNDQVRFCDMISSLWKMIEKSFVEHLWLVGGLTHGFYFSIFILYYIIYILGMSSFQLTNSIIFQRARVETTNQNLFWPQQSLGNTDDCQYVFSHTEDEKTQKWVPLDFFRCDMSSDDTVCVAMNSQVGSLDIWCHSGIP